MDELILQAMEEVGKEEEDIIGFLYSFLEEHGVECLDELEIVEVDTPDAVGIQRFYEPLFGADVVHVCWYFEGEDQ